MMTNKESLQKYFSILGNYNSKLPLTAKLPEPYIHLVENIEKLLDIKFDKSGNGRIEISKDEKEIDCIFIIPCEGDAKNYISLAEKIAYFFNRKFPYSIKDLNKESPLIINLNMGYENLLFSAGINLSSRLFEFRFTLKNNIFNKD